MIKIKNLAMSFGGNEIFNDIDFLINDGDKIGLIGRNGCGKSTLLKIMLGKLEQDEGIVEIPEGYRIGYLEQHINFTKDTVLDEVCSVLEEEREYEAWKGEKILDGLGFSEEDMIESPYKYSGGYQIKINLAKLLLSEPEMLVLDEPTNYLDIASIRWMKDFLKDWKGEILLVTHDRGFMDDVTNHTVIIHRKASKKIAGNTKKMYEQIALEEDIHERSRVNEDKQRKETQEFIDRFRSKASKAKSVQSKVKMLEKREQKEKLETIKTLDFKFNYLPYTSQGHMMEVNGLSFGYNENDLLIKNFSLKVDQGDKICVIGKNGKGKSTFLNLLTENITPINGSIKTPNKVEVGYFGQMNIQRLDATLSVYEEMQETDPTIHQTQVRRTCGKMMFSGSLSDKKISVLSGGEKSRVMLGKLLLKSSNLLVLDEPTNHLDMESCDSLMNAINDFEGAVVMVTHSEYFLKNIANRLVVFDGGKIFEFRGTYKEFLKNVGWCE